MSDFSKIVVDLWHKYCYNWHTSETIMKGSDILLNSNDYKVLICIVDKEKNIGLSQARATTKEIICNSSKLSLSTVNRAISKLLEEELIAEGIKNISKKTYYITKKGIERLREIKKSSLGDDNKWIKDKFYV